MSTVAITPVKNPVILKRRRGSDPVGKCIDCGKGVLEFEQYIKVEDKVLHTFCAVGSGVVVTCNECFMVPCDCQN